MMESRHITLRLGDGSLSETLDSYYIEHAPGPSSTERTTSYEVRLERLRCIWHGTGSS